MQLDTFHQTELFLGFARLTPAALRRKRHKVGYQDGALGLTPVGNDRDYARGYMLGIRDTRDLRTGRFQTY